MESNNPSRTHIKCGDLAPRDCGIHNQASRAHSALVSLHTATGSQANHSPIPLLATGKAGKIGGGLVASGSENVLVK